MSSPVSYTDVKMFPNKAYWSGGKLMRIPKEAAYTMHNLISIKGMCALIKAELATFELIQLIFKDRISSCLFKEHSPLKDHLYVSGILEVPDTFFYQGSFQLPKIEDTDKIDWIRLLGVGAIVSDVVHYLRKYDIYQFEWLAEQAARLGNFKAFSFHNKDYLFSDIPVVSSLCAFKPKGFFILAISSVKIGQWAIKYFTAENAKARKNLLRYSTLFDLSLDTGKIALIILSDVCKQNKSIAFLGCVVTWGGVLKEVIKIHERHKKTVEVYDVLPKNGAPLRA